MLCELMGLESIFAFMPYGREPLQIYGYTIITNLLSHPQETVGEYEKHGFSLVLNIVYQARASEAYAPFISPYRRQTFPS
jgi:hypothetical protein